MKQLIFILVGFFLGIILFNATNETSIHYDGTYCKGGYVFLDKDTWHGNNDPQLINENGGGVKCTQ